MAAVLPLDARSYELPPLTRASSARQPRPRAPRRIRPAVIRRRRLLAAALGLGFALTAARAGAALRGIPATPVRLPHVQSVVVQPGDTLWSIAHRVAPNRDPRDVVDAIAKARGSSALVPGETLTWLDS